MGQQGLSASAFRYRAFISYSHADQAAAKWLHRALESYRVPARLIGRETATGLIQKRVGTIFRDRDELPVASDLSGEINEALKATQFLIVLCSRSSAKSKWVNQEIINFKRLKGAGSIIAIILDGEPFAAVLPGREEEECFCPALRFQVDAGGNLTATPAEPIAADLRPGKDSKRLVRMKVLAGLLGVGLDELIRRDNQRRTQRLFYVAAASAAAVAVMAYLTVDAVISRNQAEAQKAQAMGLVGFMLGELHRKLEPIGRLDVLESVSDKALAYYKTLPPADFDAEVESGRLRAIMLRAKMESDSQQIDKSLASLAEGREISERLYRANPDDLQRLYDYAETFGLIGDVHFQRVQGGGSGAADERKEVESSFKQYFALSQDLERRIAGLPAAEVPALWRAQRAKAQVLLGKMYSTTVRRAQAVAELEQAVSLYQRMVTEYPRESAEWRSELAKAYDWLAYAHYELGNYDQSAEYRQREATIDKELLADPRDKLILEDLFNAQRSISSINLSQGRPAAAFEASLEALKTTNTLIQTDPSRDKWIDFKCRMLLDLAEIKLELGDFAGAEVFLAEGEEIAKGLVERNPDVLAFQTRDLGRSKILRARYYLAASKPDRAAALLASYRPVAVGVAERRSDDATARLLKCQSYLYGGLASRMLGDGAGARTHLAEAVDCLKPAQASDAIEARSVRLPPYILALYLSGDHDKARAEGAKLYASGYRRKEFLNYWEALAREPENRAKR